MKTRYWSLLAGTAAAILTSSTHTTQAAQNREPNILIILADDMGIDSVAALNPKSNIPTPNIDKLIQQGMVFSDAHSGSAVCTPTRYGILTGRYAWRSRLKRGIVGKWERSLIEDNRLTIPAMLNQEGYTTACIGKWHLGWNWPKKGGGYTSRQNEIDFSGRIGGGPLGCGFNTYFGDDVPNWPPFAWIENDRLLEMPTEKLSFSAKYHSNPGVGAKDWKLEAVLPTITEKSVNFIKSQSENKKPFFLYFAMTSPHSPIAPSKEFLGKSGISRYADFLMETDWSVGQVLKALDDSGLADNTLVFFTADNGTSPICDFAGLKKHGADIQNHWRGMKADGYEGGHRVPFIVRWPGRIKAGTKSDQVISLVDIMATCADVLRFNMPDNAAEDSVSLLPVLDGEPLKGNLHKAIICHSVSGVFIVRKGKWKLQFSAGSGGWSRPKDADELKKGKPKWQLYNLDNDPKETNNIVNEYPEVVSDLKAILKKQVEEGRSTPGKSQKNHNGQTHWGKLPWNP